MNWLFGTIGYSFIDVWTLVHFCFWIFMGSNLWAFGAKFKNALCISLAIALVWEVFERYAERTWPTIWTNPESFWNS